MCDHYVLEAQNGAGGLSASSFRRLINARRDAEHSPQLGNEELGLKADLGEALRHALPDTFTPKVTRETAKGCSCN